MSSSRFQPTLRLVFVLLAWLLAARVCVLTFQYYQHSSGGPVQRFHLESASMLLVAFLTAVVLTSPVAAQPEDRTPDRAFYDGSSIGLSSSLAAIFIVTALLLYAKGLGLGLFGDD